MLVDISKSLSSFVYRMGARAVGQLKVAIKVKGHNACKQFISLMANGRCSLNVVAFGRSTRSLSLGADDSVTNRIR